MATNEPTRPPEPMTTGATPAGGGAARAFERPEADVAPYRPGAPRNRLVSMSRSVGHYTGTAVGMLRGTRRRSMRQGIREQVEHMVREHPSVLAGAAVLGFVVGRVLRGR